MKFLEELKIVRLESSKLYRCWGRTVKVISIAALVFSFSLCGFAIESVTTDQTIIDAERQIEKEKDDKNSFIKKIKKLQDQRRRISLEIYQLRVKLIKEKPELQVLQRSIMDMHRRMAVEINKNEQIKKMLLDAKEIDRQMIAPINQNK